MMHAHTVIGVKGNQCHTSCMLTLLLPSETQASPAQTLQHLVASVAVRDGLAQAGRDQL